MRQGPRDASCSDKAVVAHRCRWHVRIGRRRACAPQAAGSRGLVLTSPIEPCRGARDRDATTSPVSPRRRLVQIASARVAVSRSRGARVIRAYQQLSAASFRTDLATRLGRDGLRRVRKSELLHYLICDFPSPHGDKWRQGSKAKLVATVRCPRVQRK
ncbi:hypothetical protein DAI22_03g340850 [Oryza sativa Japonica Group]|nr:hypothetical protein DAI22_03g340850 [Oryza sativa Japonica Group]